MKLMQCRKKNKTSFSNSSIPFLRGTCTDFAFVFSDVFNIHTQNMSSSPEASHVFFFSIIFPLFFQGDPLFLIPLLLLIVFACICLSPSNTLFLFWLFFIHLKLVSCWCILQFAFSFNIMFLIVTSMYLPYFIFTVE